MKKTAILLLVLTAAAAAQNPNLGTAGAQFLQIGVGARPMSMGGAFAAVANDAAAVFWNPSGIANVASNSFHFTSIEWWASVRLNAASYAVNLGETGTLAASVISLSMNPMEVTTELQPDGTGEMFEARDMMIGVTYARSLTDKFKAGITVKYVYQSIWNETASALAFDIGTQYELWFNRFTIGMSLTNFGADLKMDGRDLDVSIDRDNTLPRERIAPGRLQTEEYPLPLHFQVGMSMVPYSDDVFSVLLAADVTHPNDNNERINVGAELGIFERLYVRGGYRFEYDQEDLTLGGGIAMPLGGSLVAFDYSYAQYSLLPGIHRFSLGLTF